MGARAIPRGSKYHAQPTTVDGVRFASKKEARRYGELQVLVKIGEIEGLQLQPRFPCFVWRALTQQPGFIVPRVYIGDYVADFRYWRRVPSIDGPVGEVIEDVKGVKTDLYRWKKKHVEAQYGITVRET